MIGFFILLFVMIGIWVIILVAADTSEISKNWPKYRCSPTVMPLASLYGHDTTENFNYCLNAVMNEEVGGSLSPVFKIIATMLGTLSTLVSVANNIRVEMATFMGGVNTVFQNFVDRFMQLGNNIKLSTLRIKLLMGRLYGTFFSVLFMAMSGITAMTNFSETFLFRFLDTFCFNPETEVELMERGRVKVKDVRTGDVFLNGSKVTSTFSFLADGQPMVELPGPIQVSTNHYIEYKGKWIRSDQHPDAIPIGTWAGGKERPLICFNTNNHKIPVGNYVFLDYDETSLADEDTMNWVEGRLNSKATKRNRLYEYTTLLAPSTQVKLKSGKIKLACALELGDELTFGKVISVIRKKAKEACELPSGDWVTPGLMVWDSKKNHWFRAGDRYRIFEDNLNRDYYSVIVSPTANIELASGFVVRDYFEVHSPETEQFYAKAVEEASCVLAE